MEDKKRKAFESIVQSGNGLNKIKAAMGSVIISEMELYINALVLSRIAKLKNVKVTKAPGFDYKYIDIKKVKFADLNECKDLICEDLKKAIEKLAK